MEAKFDNTCMRIQNDEAVLCTVQCALNKTKLHVLGMLSRNQWYTDQCVRDHSHVQ